MAVFKRWAFGISTGARHPLRPTAVVQVFIESARERQIRFLSGRRFSPNFDVARVDSAPHSVAADAHVVEDEGG